MASRKITEYTALTTPASDDVLPIIDISETAANQNKKITIPNLTGQLSAASTSAAGIVQLNDTTASTSTSQAATANAVKAAYDLANAALPKAGGTMSGVITYASTQPRLVQETAKASTSGTTVEFTGIPSWVKRITVMFSGVSTNGSSAFLMQLGTSSGFTTSGYNSYGAAMGGSSISAITSTAGILCSGSTATANNYGGVVILGNVSGNTWAGSSSIGTSASTTNGGGFGAGNVTLSAVLDRVRVTTVSANTFDAGSINIMYEG
jgi:hypothetical protein